MATIGDFVSRSKRWHLLFKKISNKCIVRARTRDIHETTTDIEVKDKLYKLYYNLEGDLSKEKITSDLKVQTEKSRTDEPERFFINAIEQKVNLLLPF